MREQEGQISIPRRIIVAALAWLSAALPFIANGAEQPERWSELSEAIFRNYGVDDGLPTASVMAFAEDDDGFLWIGTQAGLARWDGYRFHIYRSDPADPSALQNDFIWSLKKDREGRLWVGTNGGVLSRYDRATDRFVTVALDSPDHGNAPIRAMIEDGVGGMWVGSDQGAYHIAPDGTVLLHYQNDSAESAILPGDQVRALLRDRSGRLWIGTNKGLARQDTESSKFVPMALDPEGAVAILSLFEASDGRIWVGTRDRGIYSFDPLTGIVQKGPSELNSLTIQAIAETSPGVIWLATLKGMVVMDSGKGTIKRMRHDAARPSSLPHDLLFSLYKDRSGLLWAGTYSGLGLLDPTQDAVLTLFGASNNAQGLKGADVMATLSAQDGNIWVSYIAGGLDIIDPAQHRLAPAQDHLPPDQIRALAQSNTGEIYAGTERGLYLAKSGSKEFTRLRLSQDTPYPSILSLLSDSRGLWVGTYGGAGLWRVDYGTRKTHRYAEKGLANRWISALLPVGDGRLWVGTYQGLYLLDPLSERIDQVLPAPQDTRSPPGGLIASLVRDHQGRVWVGTVGGGIVLLEGNDADGRPRFHQIGIAEGLPDLKVTSLAADEEGTIWASLGNGQVASIDPGSLALHLLQRAEGVGIRGFSMYGGSVTAHGELLFGGDGGLVVIRPDRLKLRSWRPPVVITDLRIGGHQLPPQGFNSNGGPHLEITPEANSISVEFAALDYSAPERNRYAYQLEGYDDAWVSVDATRRVASYTNLPPGSYTLHLRGSNRDGVWSEATFDLPFKVLPAWYQTPQFRIALVILGIAGIWGLVRVRTSYLRHRQIVLENQVEERTAELQQSNSQLELRTAELGQSLQKVAESRSKVADLLDTSGQGFLSFGTDLIVDPDYSRACVSMLGRAPEGCPADEILFDKDKTKSELFRKAILSTLASQDSFKRNLLLSLLPATIERGDRQLKAEYRPLDNGHIMVVLTDITEEKRLSERIDNERQRLALIVAAVTESWDFFDAVESFRQFFSRDLAEILAARSIPLSVHREIYRQIHTLKGTFAQFNFDSTPRMLHKLEEELSALAREPDSMTIGKIVELVLSTDCHGALEKDLAVLRNALGDDFVNHGKGIFLPMSKARQLRAAAERLLAGESLDSSSAEIRDLFAEFRHLDKITLIDALAAYDRVIQQIAHRLGKEMAPLSIEGSATLRLDPEIFGPFLRSLIHIFRNAVVHGIEDPDERLANGKEAAGRIDCVIRQESGFFTLTIADDGAGLDVEAIRLKAVSLGLLSEKEAKTLSDEETHMLIFADALTVRDRADELAGRGVGLSAVQAETEVLGGRVALTSAPGQGTRFEFYIPLVQKVDASATHVTGI